MSRRFINPARRSPLRLFDVYLAVDWSARSKPSAVRPTHDALWIGETLAVGLHDSTVSPETYRRTRYACVEYLRSRLIHHSVLGRRVLVGFDFAFGYPAGFARALGLSGDAPWRLHWNELARQIVDDEQNGNNRFAVAAQFNARCGNAPGPFWGCTAGQANPSLEMTSPRGGYPYPARYGLSLERLRCTDKVERGVQSVWKLSGSGSVGGQTLLGIPAVLRLRNDPQLSNFGRVWPFETGFGCEPISPQGPALVYAEIWPGLLATQLDSTLPIRDQAQVRAVVQWLARLDTAGTLAALFESPSGLSEAA